MKKLKYNSIYNHSDKEVSFDTPFIADINKDTYLPEYSNVKVYSIVNNQGCLYYKCKILRIEEASEYVDFDYWWEDEYDDDGECTYEGYILTDFDEEYEDFTEMYCAQYGLSKEEFIFVSKGDIDIDTESLTNFGNLKNIQNTLFNSNEYTGIWFRPSHNRGLQLDYKELDI